MHYGEKILQIQKDEKYYGDIFSYEEFQEIHKAETKEDFQSFLNKSKFKEAIASNDSKKTYELIKLVNEKVNIKENPPVSSATLLDIFIVPFSIICKAIQLKKIERKINNLKST